MSLNPARNVWILCFVYSHIIVRLNIYIVYESLMRVSDFKTSHKTYLNILNNKTFYFYCILLLFIYFFEQEKLLIYICKLSVFQ